MRLCIVECNRSRLLVRSYLHFHLLGKGTLYTFRTQRLTINFGIETALYHYPQLRPLFKGFNHLFQFFQLGGQQAVASGMEGNSIHLPALVAKKATQRSERRSHDLGDQVDQRLPDHMPVTEFRIVHIATHRHCQIDFTLSVGKECDSQIQRQINCVWCLHPLAEGELI